MKIHGSAIGQVLRQARLDAGMLQQDLAATLGISPSCLNRVEHGRTRFDTRWIVSMPPGMRASVRDALEKETEASGRFTRRAG